MVRSCQANISDMIEFGATPEFPLKMRELCKFFWPRETKEYHVILVLCQDKTDMKVKEEDPEESKLKAGELFCPYILPLLACLHSVK